MCNLKASTRFFHPTRLLDTSNSDDMSTITLVESSNLRSLRSHSRYLALSPCWGGIAPVILTSNNIDSLKAGIKLAELPKTFQHAIALARFVHVRYLWIDSLCIIQDSDTDWKCEAAAMKDVYKHATLTIAATGAETSNDGLYFHRDADLAKAVTVVISWWGLPIGTWTVCLRQLSEKNIVEGPLNQRGWVVQERLLSRRTLHFGREQIAWDCYTLQACETFPGRQPKLSASVLNTDFWSRSQRNPMDLVRSDWPDIAETYAGCRLTKETDKCMAISGIAEEIQLATGDLYFAGLWESSFAIHLCWIVHHLKNETQRRTRVEPPLYRAPSWSWLSIDSNVDFFSVTNHAMSAPEILFDVLRVEIENAGLNKFGPIKGGFLVGRGMLKPGMWTDLTDDRTSRLLIDGQYVKHGSFWGHFSKSQVTLDEGHQKGNESVWCLPLLRGTNTPMFIKISVVGLILVPTDQASQEYKRIGGFHFTNELAEQVLNEWIDATHQIITIV